MGKIVLYLIVGLLAITLKVYSQTQDESVELVTFLEERGYVAIPMNERPTGHLYINAAINRIPATLFLDTGGTITILDKERTGRFESRTSLSTLIIAGIGADRPVVRRFVIEEFSLAGFHLENFRIHLLSLSYINDSFRRMGLEEIDGVIGADILHRYRAIIDYGNLVLHLTNRRNDRRGRHGPVELTAFLEERGYAAIPINRHPSGHLYINAEINGITAALILDTGAGATVFGQMRAEEFQLKEDFQNVIVVGVGGNLTATAATVQELRMADFYVENPEIHLLCLYYFNYFFRREGFQEMDGIIGANVLKTYRAIIDYGNLMLYLKRSSEEYSEKNGSNQIILNNLEVAPDTN